MPTSRNFADITFSRFSIYEKRYFGIAHTESKLARFWLPHLINVNDMIVKAKRKKTLPDRTQLRFHNLEVLFDRRGNSVQHRIAKVTGNLVNRVKGKVYCWVCLCPHDTDSPRFFFSSIHKKCATMLLIPIWSEISCIDDSEVKFKEM